MNHYLSLILFLPLIGAFLVLLVPKQNEDAIRWIANVTAFAGFAISVPLWFWYNPQSGDFQFVERAQWIPSIGAEYFLGVDGLSTLLILLTTMMGFIAVLSSWTAITERVKEYYIFLLLLQTGMLGAFMFGPLAAVVTTWVLAERIYRDNPARLTALMIAGFVGKLVFFAAYVAIVLGVFSHHPVPFVVSFTSYFIALYLMEAIFLRRLFADGPHPSR